MHALTQALKALDPRTFHEMCFHIMKEKYPSADVHLVEGVSGDMGVDVFAGDLDGTPVIWQCKCFQVTLMGQSQKQQIRDSLRQALENFSPKIWELCLNIDMDQAAHRWFQKFRISTAKRGVEVRLFEGQNLVHELIFRRTLRNTYFSNVALDVVGLKQLIRKSDCFSDDELKAVTAENAEQYIDMLEKRDTRFRYEVTVGGDRGPAAFPPPAEPGLFAASSDGRITIKAFGRDLQSLAIDPPRLRLSVSQSGAQKLYDLIETGQPQSLDASEVLGLDSSFPLLDVPPMKGGGFTISVAPGDNDANPRIPLKLSFVGAHSSVTYDYVEFRLIRAGTREIEISTNEDDLPFYLSMVFRLPLGSHAHLTFGKRFAGKEVIQVQKAISLIGLLGEGCMLEMHSLRHGAQLGKVRLDPIKMGIAEGMKFWTDRLVRISKTFGAAVRIPDDPEVYKKSFDSVAFLYSLATGEPCPMDGMTMELVKDETNSLAFPDIINHRVPICVQFPWAKVDLLGTMIHIGPHRVTFDEIEFAEPTETLNRFQRAKLGEGVPIRVVPLRPVRLSLLSDAISKPSENNVPAGRQL